MLTSVHSGQAKYGDVECIYLDVSAQALSYKGRVTTLSKRQWEIVHALLRVPGHTVSSESLRALLDERSSDALSDGTLTVHIHHLRRKLSGLPIWLLRNRGAAGYYLDFRAPLDVVEARAPRITAAVDRDVGAESQGADASVGSSLVSEGSGSP